MKWNIGIDFTFFYWVGGGEGGEERKDGEGRGFFYMIFYY
jgi:hypothetical protein